MLHQGERRALIISASAIAADNEICISFLIAPFSRFPLQMGEGGSRIYFVFVVKATVEQ